MQLAQSTNASPYLDEDAMTGPSSTRVQQYWDEHIHDLEIATHPVGTPGFFQELDSYRFEKLDYLPRLVDFAAFCGKELLEVGCGIGTDLVRFARAGARVTGIDLSPVAIELARRNFSQHGLSADLRVMDGQRMSFQEASFDVVYIHGVLQYAADDRAIVAQAYRVLRPGGFAIMMVYNRRSWLPVMSKLTGVGLEHEDAPVLRLYSVQEFRDLLAVFDDIRIVPERFPVETRLHRGLKATLYNRVFVRGFGLLPKVAVRSLGWHLVAFADKASDTRSKAEG
jgi:SAM-dependent methyltransferase